jgi:thiol-disulfide isomerase/thioredoxin
MPKPVPTLAAAILALALAGCASTDSQEPSAASPSTSAPAATVEPSAPSTTDTASPGSSAKASAEETDKPTAAGSSSSAASEGSWIDQSAYDADPASYHSAGDVVLFFNASWCPTCKETVKNLDADGVPAGLTVVSVDYDDSSELKKKHGVTVQHTFVQVDESGKQLAKFTGSDTGEQIAAKTV